MDEKPHKPINSSEIGGIVPSPRPVIRAVKRTSDQFEEVIGSRQPTPSHPDAIQTEIVDGVEFAFIDGKRMRILRPIDQEPKRKGNRSNSSNP